MKKTERESMLLFSKERVAGLHRYRLYFTPVSSLRDDTPRVFRLLVRLPFAFERFELGRIYTLQYSGIYIYKFEPRETFSLQEEDYVRLLHIRDVKFMDKRTSAALRSNDQPDLFKDRYYSFEETRAIVNYRPDFLTTVAISAFSAILIGIALLLPLGLYVWMIYLLAKGQSAIAGFSPGALVLPLMGLGALPVTMFLMSILFAFAELALLRIDFTRWHILKKYTLAWGGIRKSIFFERSDIRYYKKFGMVTGIILAVFLLICIII
jgi:hypothetical protein